MEFMCSEILFSNTNCWSYLNKMSLEKPGKCFYHKGCRQTKRIINFFSPFSGSFLNVNLRLLKTVDLKIFRNALLLKSRFRKSFKHRSFFSLLNLSILGSIRYLVHDTSCLGSAACPELTPPCLLAKFNWIFIDVYKSLWFHNAKKAFITWTYDWKQTKHVVSESLWDSAVTEGDVASCTWGKYIIRCFHF